MIVILILCLLGLLVYSDSFFNSFHFDDFHTIVNNAAIRDFHHLHDLWNIEPTRIIPFLSFALNYHWGALNVCGFHIFNLLAHVATSILVWKLVLLISEETPWIAFFTAAIFLTHPLQTQAVNYIYQRSVLLAAFFYLASLILFIKKGKLNYFGSLGCAVLSMFCKENSVSLPVMICFYQWFFLRDQKEYHWKRVWPFFLVPLVMPLSWGVLNLKSILGIKSTVAGLAQGLTVKQYALTQSKVILTYLKLLILPFHQRVEYDFTPATSFFDASVICSILFLILILITAILLRNRLKLVSFGIIWFFITLMPESSFWPNKDLIFEHRLYLPLLGFGICLSSGLFYFFQSKSSTIAIRILLLLVIVYCFLTFQRNKVWRDEFSLWDDAVHQSPKDSRAYLNRGAAYQNRGDLDHALADYNTVIALGIIDPVTLSNRGLVLEKKGDYYHALANYNLAIKINSGYAGTYINRAFLYKIEGRLDLALSDINKAINFLPNNVELYEQRAEIQGMMFLIANMPEIDLKSLNGDFLMENVHLGLQAISEVPWGKDIPQDIFLNDVLPYASLNERRDNWRADFYQRFIKIAIESKTIDQAVKTLNKYVFDTLKVSYSATQRPKPDQSPYESMEAHYASCTGLSILLTDALRSVGIPARIAAIAMWPDGSGNHTWVEIWDGKWHYVGAAEGGELDHTWFSAKASKANADHPIFAASFQKTGISFPMRWAPDLKYVPAVDVTENYKIPVR